MCSKNSRVDGCIFGFVKYVMAESRVERFGRQDVNFSSEQFFEEFGKPEEVVEGLSLRFKFHEDVNVSRYSAHRERRNRTR